MRMPDLPNKLALRCLVWGDGPEKPTREDGGLGVIPQRPPPDMDLLAIGKGLGSLLKFANSNGPGLVGSSLGRYSTNISKHKPVLTQIELNINEYC